MTLSVTLRWVLAALAGLLIAAAVAVLASKLTSQRIGLASEPVRAGEALAPVRDAPSRDHAEHGQRQSNGDRRDDPSPPATSTTSAPTTTSVETDDSGIEPSESGVESSDDD